MLKMLSTACGDPNAARMWLRKWRDLTIRSVLIPVNRNYEKNLLHGFNSKVPHDEQEIMSSFQNEVETRNGQGSKEPFSSALLKLFEFGNIAASAIFHALIGQWLKPNQNLTLRHVGSETSWNCLTCIGPIDPAITGCEKAAEILICTLEHQQWYKCLRGVPGC